MNEGRWYQVKYVDGTVMNTMASSETEVREKSQNHHKGEISSVISIGNIQSEKDYDSF